MPALSFVFTWWLPAAVQLSFFVSGLVTFLQARAFQNPAIRRKLGITALPTKAATSPYQGILRTAPAPLVPSGPKSGSALSSQELNGRFQASSPPTQPISKTRELLNKLKAPIVDAASTGKALMNKGNESMDSRRAKNELEAKQRYEVKRAEELKKKRWETERARIAARDARY